MIEARIPDIVLVDKVRKETMIIDVVIPWDARPCNKERDKNQQKQLFKRQHCQIVDDEKGHCVSHCSLSIKSYKNKIYWKSWNWDQNRVY